MNTSTNWTEQLEDLLSANQIQPAISFLESIISQLEQTQIQNPSSLSSALDDLASLYSLQGFSLKADDLRLRSLLLRTRTSSHPNPKPDSESSSKNLQEAADDEDDDWEAIADRGAALSLNSEEVASTPTPVDPPLVAPKRRGRGSFLYQKSHLYSDQPDVAAASAPEDGAEGEDGKVGNSRFGTGHVLVLYDFPTTTRTIDLENLLSSFKDRGFNIQWVNDTTALAVFRTPYIAQEAQSSINCPFKVRLLDENDLLLTQISTKDLEPPIPRPKTSARTAQRLIFQGMGMKISTGFGSSELRKQEEARKNRILSRHTMKDDAWGSEADEQ